MAGGAAVVEGADLGAIDPHFNRAGAAGRVVNDVDPRVDAPATGRQIFGVIAPQRAVACTHLGLKGRGAAGGIAENLKNGVTRRAVLRVEISLKLLAAGRVIIVHLPLAARAAVVGGEV